MRRTLLWLLASLAFASFISKADGTELKVMSAPNLLRVGTVENIFLECQDCKGGDITVSIFVMNHPTKTLRLATTSVTLTSAQDFQGIGQIKIPTEEFSRDPTVKQYVYLQAQFPDKLLEKVVLVSFQSGYIFIQTDKTLYTPNSRLHYRIFALTPGMEPVERDETTDATIDIEIMTPEDITFPVDIVSLNSGIHSGYYQLPDIVSMGIWKVVAKFHSNPQQTFSAEFEVKEYVLPSFEVKLIPLSSFFYVDSETLTINIKAKYLFGEEVVGSAYVVFGVVHEGQKKSFPDSVQKVEIAEGEGEVILKREHITQSFNINDLVGSPIFVVVSVLTENGGEMVEAELRGIQIVTSPYSIVFKRTPKYFKPGMSFDVAVEVLNPDDSPAEGVQVVVMPGEVRGLTAANGMAKVTVNTMNGAASLAITAKTDDPQISPERQASATMNALPYQTSGNNYIHIGVDTAELQLGNNLKISLNLNRRAGNDITYLILSRSQLVRYGRYTTQGQVLISLIVPITKDMLPSFRIIAYYHTDANEVVSDSVWVDVKDTCMGSLRLEPSRPAIYYEPRSMFGLTVTGDPGATVGLVAVDKGVYVLNNKYRLTQKKIWDIVEKYDTGCTPGGGKDSMGVFYDAGLLFESSSGSGTPYRQELKCLQEAPKRRKRSDTITSVITSLLSQYKHEQQRKCCMDGIRDTPLSYSCERRSQYITDGQDCIDAFLNCCNTIATQKAERRDEELHLARSEADDDSYMDSNEIVSRTQFPESWLWSDIILGLCPHNAPNCKTTSKGRDVPLPDSITTWQFTGISLSQTHGICVSEPLEVTVRKDFFIDLRLPYSAVRGEQLEIKAILHNYSPKRVNVRVDLLEEEHVCSSASKRSKYRQQVKVASHSSRSVPFIIIPMKEGTVNVEVKAAVQDSHLHDGIRKLLRVVPEGELIKHPQTIILDPVNNGADGRQVEILNSGIQRRDLVPNTPTSTQISVTGMEQVGALVEDAISGQSMGNMIYQPSGCGEQNMIHMTMPVIATLYLDKTSQWEAVGFQKRDEAIKHIMYGYQRELAYRKRDGSFAAFPERQSSIWLTAYVAKVFAMANSLVAVQKEVICGAVKFVILNGQQPDGMFKEGGPVIHGEMMGDIRGGQDSDVSMTAFCLIALQETRTLCSDTINSLPASIGKAVTYLEKHLPNLKNPYAVAIASYALANEEKLDKDFLYRFVSSELNHWRVPRGHIYTIEATGYALLALVRAKALEEARPIVRWMSKQQRAGRGYGSTQATIIVYQAVAEYWVTAKEPEYNLNVDILLPGRSKPDSYSFNRDNHYATRTSKISSINQDVKVTATGTGEATVTMVSLYYAIPKEKESDCQKFNLSVQLIPEKENDEEKVYRLKIEYFYKDEQRDAGMSILDIGLLTGFTADINDLNRLAKGPSRTISRYEMNTALSDRGSLIIYLKSASHTQTEEVAFRIRQTLKVGVLQPAAVSIYEYYDQKHCVKFYHPERRAGHLMRLCRNDECTCAEENCSLQKKEKVDNEQRIAKSCESTPTSKIDYVYKVRVENYTDGVSTDFYTMRVLESIKEGNLDVGPRGKLRIFLGYPHCREALDLRDGNTYLIMGTSQDIYRDNKLKTFQYVLGERTWVEYWPKDEECQSDEHRDTCVGMQKMVQVYTIKGCNE